MIFRKGELFNGPGGFALGAQWAKVLDSKGQTYGVSHTWSNDICPDASQTYIQNICPNQPNSVITGDVRSIDISELDSIDAFIFGFPCNDFSNVGKKKGVNGTYGPLYTYGVKVLKQFKPLWFIAENVGGLKSSNDGKAFATILEDMIDAGYNVTPHLYNFADYGVPQSRQRIIIVGIRNDLDFVFKVPKPTHGINGNHPYKTAYEAIMDPVIPADAPNHEFTRHTNKVVEMLEHIPPGENAWYEGIPEHLRLNVKGARMSQIYRRLHPEQPAYTVTGSGGGGTHVYHWEEPRALTNRERARLQTFPDDFEFYGGKEKVRQQIGMAVPPHFAKIIVESVLKTFAGVSYESIKPKWSIDELLSSNSTKVLEEVAVAAHSA